MKRKNYKKKPKIIKEKWAVLFLGGDWPDCIDFYQTRAEAMKEIRFVIQDKRSATCELFKLESKFIEAWQK
jgi:hypothetical protein